MIESKDRPRVSVKINDPATNATPRMTAKALMTNRSLRAMRLFQLARSMAQALPSPRDPRRPRTGPWRGAPRRRSTCAARTAPGGAPGPARARRGAPSGRGPRRASARGARRRSAPSARKTTRSVQLAAFGSWVTMTMVWPNSSTERRRKPSTSAPEVLSRLPVGSSAKMTSGRLTSARAQATRCCWPPESSPGRWSSRSRSPTVSMTWSNQSPVRLAAGDGERQEDVLLGRQRRDEVEGLEDEADVVAPGPGEVLLAQGGQLGVAEEDPAAGHRVQAGGAVHERRLARARTDP